MMHEDFMREAIIEAKKAEEIGEVPIGAVVVQGGQIIARGHNQRELKNQAISHAEIEAITSACEKLGTWRLSDCDLYVTLEPCPMCAGAIINARINTVYFGAYDQKAGCAGSHINLFDCGFNHRPNLKSRILEQECVEILQKFFEKLRNKI
ncbi:MAG: nucleoside deaminase [Clostridia bacterium]